MTVIGILTAVDGLSALPLSVEILVAGFAGIASILAFAAFVYPPVR
jgi:hypothetical protein